MNRYRTKKKGKDIPEQATQITTSPDLPTLKMTKSKWGKRTAVPEPKKEIDLQNVLPSSDDFRTSLLMNGLSARFSMLREQDDPKSKLGKASDDSVLFPTRRQSRLDSFGLQKGLSDIAEVSSIKGSVRPPFAFGRPKPMESGDGYGTDDDVCYGGAIMSRPKPGEGNVLFGGRQKIYKIPASNKASGEGGLSMGGRALYENDVSQSAFQKLRERGRPQQPLQDSDEDLPSEPVIRPESPPLAGYNSNRETSSTTSSGAPSTSISSSSTVATSVASQRTPVDGSRTPNSANPLSGNNLERVSTKTRRLYEKGLDQYLHDQHFSAMSRIDILTRQGATGGQTPPPGLHSPVSASSTGEKWDLQQILDQASWPTLRPSPPNASSSTLDFNLKTDNLPEARQALGLASPPLSPATEGEQGLLPTHPNDRGKATALGTFNRPVQPYDETQYSQRQLQMQQGREMSPWDQPAGRIYVPYRPANPAGSEERYIGHRSRSTSSALRQHPPREQEADLSSFNQVAQKEMVSSPAAGTCLNTTDNNPPCDVGQAQNYSTWESLSPIDPSQLCHDEQTLNVERPPQSEQLALQEQLLHWTETPIHDHTTDHHHQKPNSIQSATDSPTLGPTSGLSNIVRQHLRTDSTTSSNYGATPAALSSWFPQDSNSAPQHGYMSKENPWEIDDWDPELGDGRIKFNLEALETKSRLSVDPAERAPLTDPSPNLESVQESYGNPWETSIELPRSRAGSTDTQQEQLDFRTELVARRRRVQENLKSYVETESRSTSPLRGSDGARDTEPPKNYSLGILKSKTSRASIVAKPREMNSSIKEPSQSKAMRILGLGSPTVSSTPLSPNQQPVDDNLWSRKDQKIVEGMPKVRDDEASIRSFRQARRDAQRDRERQLAIRHQQQQMDRGKQSPFEQSSRDNSRNRSKVVELRRRYEGDDSDYPQIQQRHRNPGFERRIAADTAMSHSNGNSIDTKESGSSRRSGSRQSSRSPRDRSTSGVSEARSKSRNARYRDDLAKAMAEGTGSTGQSVLEDFHSARYFARSSATSQMRIDPSPSQSPLLGSRQPSRSNSNDRSTPGYFAAQKPPKLRITTALDIGSSPRPSPVTPFSLNATPPFGQPSNVSGSNTPTTQGLQSPGRFPETLKRSVHKHEISVPTLISSTSHSPLATMNLSPGASLHNSFESAPPIPATNPRRRQTRAIFGIGKKEEQPQMHAVPVATPSSEEISTFSDDDKPRSRQSLRKSSSDGGNLKARARQAATQAPVPAMPALPSSAVSFSSPTTRNGMF